MREREAAENFPVALRFLPQRHRRDLHTVYAFARTVDEIGDSAAGDRTALLHDFDAQLDRVWSTEQLDDPVLMALRSTVTAHGLPADPFHRLVQANLTDQYVCDYASYEELLGYCRLSADPIGEMVLGIFGCVDAARVALSNHVCTALQLLEHWQDVREDRRNGRIYLPREDLQRFGVADDDLDRPAPTPALRALIRFQTERAAALLEQGAPIVSALRGWARPCVAGFVAGGRATVSALRRADGDVFSRPVRASKAGTATRLVAMLARAARQGGRR